MGRRAWDLIARALLFCASADGQLARGRTGKVSRVAAAVGRTVILPHRPPRRKCLRIALLPSDRCAALPIMASALCTRFAWRQRQLGRRSGFAAAANRTTVADDNFRTPFAGSAAPDPGKREAGEIIAHDAIQTRRRIRSARGAANVEFQRQHPYVHPKLPWQRLPLQQTLIRAVLGAVLCAVTAPAQAQRCDARPPQSQFAREDLRRAVTEGDLATAQDYADRARRGLDQLAGVATRCGCAVAQAKFEATSAQVRHARDAESRRELRDVITAAVPMFDDAMMELRNCAKP